MIKGEASSQCRINRQSETRATRMTAVYMPAVYKMEGSCWRDREKEDIIIHRGRE